MSTQQQTTAVAVRPVDMLKNMINSDSVQQQFQNALGKHKDGFVASLIDLYSGDKALQTCKPQDVIKQALMAATLNLPLNKALGFSYIVVYNNNVKSVDAKGNTVWNKVPTPTFIPGYKGYIQLAMRTGQYRVINCDVIFEGELRVANKLTGEIALDGTKKSDKVTGYFAHFELLNGFSKTLFMPLENMARHAKTYSPSLKNNNKVTVESLMALGRDRLFAGSVGWISNFESMALKTVLRNLLSHYGYLSIEMQQVIASDNEEAGAEAERNNANMQGLETVDVDAEVLRATELNEAGAEAESAEQPQQAAPSAPAGPAY